MAQCTTAVSFVQATPLSCNIYSFHGVPRKPKVFIQYNRLCLCHGKFANFQRNGGLSSSWLGSLELSSNVANISCKGKVLDKEEGFPPIQTLQRYPTEELFAKVVMVRFDSSILLHQKLDSISITSYAFLTIRYAYEAGAKCAVA